MTDLRKMSNEELLQELCNTLQSVGTYRGPRTDAEGKMIMRATGLQVEILSRLDGAAPSEGMKPLSPARSGELSAPPACPECKTQLRDETAWYRCDTCLARYSSTIERGLYRLPDDRFAAPQTSARPLTEIRERYESSMSETAFTDAICAAYDLGRLRAAPQPVSGDAPKVEEIARQLSQKFGFHSSRVLTYEGALGFLRPYFPPASQTPPISEHVLNEIVLAICEIPDRTSPDDFPEAMIVTPEELRFIIRDKFEQAATPASTARTDGWIDPENYVAWCRRSKNTIVTCDSDAPGAFKVYRLAAPGSVPQAPVAANTRCSEHKVFHPACADCWKEYYKSPAFGVPPAEPPKEEKP